MRMKITFPVKSCMVENMDDSNNILKTQEDDLELVQNQEALDCKLQLPGPPLPSVVELEDIEASICSCAPGEKNAPEYVLLDKNFEVCWPFLICFLQEIEDMKGCKKGKQNCHRGNIISRGC